MAHATDVAVKPQLFPPPFICLASARCSLRWLPCPRLKKNPIKPTSRMAVAASMATSLTFALLPSQGLHGSTRSLPFTKPLRRFSRKAGSNLITAKFDLKPPPYPLNALEPHMSQETFAYHWGKHHRAYVENLNKQIVGTELEGLSLEEIIIVSYNNGDILPAFNNAAQAWNHEFFWESMKPGGGGKPSGDLLDLIERDFGSFERFIEEFKSAAATQFGSGWAWLAYKANRLDVENAANPWPSEKDKKLVVVKSPNAVNPLVWGYFPLLTIDVWEHAYYLDFQNRRPDYISMFMEKLVSWEAVSARLERAKAQAAQREIEEERRKKEEEKEQIDDEAVEMYVDSDIDDSEAE